MKIPFFLSVAFAIAISSGAYAQNPTNPAPASAAKPAKIEVVAEGELRLDGKLTGLLGANSWTMNAFSFTSPRGVTKDFDEPKSKVIKITAATYLHPVGEETKIALKDVKVGTPIGVIGKAGPENSIIAREIVLLAGYGQRKTVGTLQSNPFSGLLIDQSRKARDMGQMAKALELAQKAAEGAAGLNDKSGEALATRDVALLYLETQQYQLSLDASVRVEKLGRELGNELALSIGLSGKGDAYSALDKNEDALKAYVEAATYGVRVSNTLGASILNRLMTTYLGLNQFDNAAQTLEKLEPLETGSGQPNDAARSRMLIAILRTDTDPASAKAALPDAEQALTRATEPAEKASALFMLALLQWRLGQNDAAKARLEEAKKIYEVQNETKGVTRMQQTLDYIQKAPNADESIADIILGRMASEETKAALQ